MGFFFLYAAWKNIYSVYVEFVAFFFFGCTSFVHSSFVFFGTILVSEESNEEGLVLLAKSTFPFF